MTRIAFIDVGNMGAGMALNQVKKGEDSSFVIPTMK